MSEFFDRDQRLSRSRIWQLQRAFFERLGVAAWGDGIVPHYITNNPFIAAAYAEIVFGFLRDAQSSGAPQRQIQIIELGAGSGRFAFHFLKALIRLCDPAPGQPPPFTYVLTDFAAQTVAYWPQHPALRPFVEAGYLDFARFDATSDQAIRLGGGALLEPGAPGGPTVILANYFFDSIPQDAFAIEGGRLHECLITIACQPTNGGMPADSDDPSLFKRISDISYSRRQVSADYYGDPAFNELLRAYCGQLDNTVLAFPCAGLECLRLFRALAPDRLLVLAGDKAYGAAEALRDQREPQINVHGSFSMTVNYHALGQYTLRQGGQFLHTGDRHTHLNIAAFLFGQPASAYQETSRAYLRAMERFSPDDFFVLKKGIEPLYGALALAPALAYLRLSGWDANIFFGCVPGLLDQARRADAAERADLAHAIEQVWANYYDIGEPNDLAFALGTLCYTLADYPQALAFFAASIESHGIAASSAYNLAMCHYALGQPDAARAWVEQAVALDPGIMQAADPDRPQQ